MSGRDSILGTIRSNLARAGDAAAARERIAAHRRNLVPARAASLDHAGQVALFIKMAEAVQATVTRVANPDMVPEEVARYLAATNLPAALVMAPDPALDALPWGERPLLQIRRGRADPGDLVSLTPCFAAIAETGTLMLTAGAETPTTLNFLPDTHVVVVRGDQVVAAYEDGWDRLRARGEASGAAGDAKGWPTMPRVVNFITGPSRTGDIEQRIQLGAHGPRRLHIIVVDDAVTPENGEDRPSG